MAVVVDHAPDGGLGSREIEVGIPRPGRRIFRGRTGLQDAVAQHPCERGLLFRRHIFGNGSVIPVDPVVLVEIQAVDGASRRLVRAVHGA